MEAGWDPEEAQAHALDAMGEAKEVGRALDREFPLRWLVLSRLSLAALVLAIAVALPFLFPAVAGAAGSLQARWDPAAYAAAHFEEPPPLVPLDVQWEIYDGTVLSLYGVGLRELPQEGYYSADLYTVLYHRNPFRSTPLLLGELWVTTQGTEEDLFVPFPTGLPLSGTTHQNCNATYSVIEASGDFAGQNITLHYQYLDTSFALDISLPWEEVLP
ncbi:MAG TPA: hypothetical protein H9833_08765 [Candidatus Evtepia faecavium]|nr:hypothetical protein [Candidatus Evtepia faecavium]